MKKRVICFHLYNDFSGSPTVLFNVLEGLVNEGYKIDLYTSKGGILSNFENKNIRSFFSNYKFQENKVYTFIHYFLIQIYWFFISFKYLFTKNNVFYINTILPIGPAFCAFIMRKRLVCHFHENPEKNRFYKFLTFVMKKMSNKIICVSKFQMSKVNSNRATVVYNSIPRRFVELGKDHSPIFSSKMNVLMLSSLKEYKGLKEYILVSELFPSYSFDLVINASQDEIDLYFAETKIPINLKLYSKQSDTSIFYSKCNLLLNLSIPELFVETFGLTVTEAMAFGVPAIVPPIGGVAELIENGYNGYKVHSKDIQQLCLKIEKIFASEKDYIYFSENAKKESRKYNEEEMIADINKILISI